LREFLSFSCRQYSKKSVWQGFSNDLFSFKLFQVIYKSYRQVLTSSQISRLLLKPGCLDKFRLAYNLTVHSSLGEMGIPDDLETTSVDVKRSPLKRERRFLFRRNV